MHAQTTPTTTSPPPPRRRGSSPNARATSWLKRALMTLLTFTLAALASGCFNAKERKAAPAGVTTPEGQVSFHDFTLNAIDGEEVPLSRYKGKHVLVVNTASRCGYTPQYEQLQAFHERYGDKVAVLGFPSNDFMGQEPGSNADIADFCKRNYGVTFQMFEKIPVKGADAHPLYRWLASKAQNGWNDQAPTWNFSKYLIAPDGRLLRYFGPGVLPDDPDILALINQS
jgi:glutathione peroxidase